ncbi:MAG TPA: TIM barrel protein [Abditibacterium sp.]|jgi:sugar phosphate isomerase/epimerase
MLRPGLVSVSFRDLTPREIIDLCVQNRLEGIEWGGDIHVPSDEPETAREVGQMTRNAGLEVACYGSYFRCEGEDFAPVLECAVELGAPLIRVWAGKISGDASPEQFEAVRSRLIGACEMAQKVGIQIATEYHGGTLTQTRDSARQLLEIVAHPNLKTLWQPLRRGGSLNAKISENLDDLRDIAPYLSNIHVYEWRDIVASQTKRFSLENSPQWPKYVEELRKIGGDRWMLLEFVPGDLPLAVATEAAALRRWCSDDLRG